MELEAHIYLRPSAFTCSNFQSFTLSQSVSYAKPGKTVNSIYIVILKLVRIKLWGLTFICIELEDIRNGVSFRADTGVSRHSDCALS